MGPPSDLSTLGVAPAVPHGLGHNAHVESPGAVLELIESNQLLG